MNSAKISGFPSIRGVVRYCLVLSVAVALYACVGKPELPEPDGGELGSSIERVEDLKFNSLSLRPEENEFIYGKVVFELNAAGTEWTAVIENYKADLSGLKLVFDVDAERVTVGGVEQVSGTTVNDFTRKVIFRLYTVHGEYRDFNLSVTNPSSSYSGFPVLALMTEGGQIVDSKEDWVAGRVVLDPQQSDYESFSGTMEVKGRGHNSWSQPKKPYNIKLSEKAALMDMNKNKRWVLLANAGDRTLMRNRVAYQLGKLTKLPWTPDTRYVDVMLNGKFVGNYLLTEQIRVDKNRVNITEAQAGMAPEQVGYLLEFDRYVEENYFYSKLRQLPVNIKDPDVDLLTAAQKEYISGYIERVEGMLYNGASVDPAYRDLIDIDTFIDWWMVIELTENRDTRLPGSCYMYKDAQGKLCAGPLWDFDLTTFQGGTREFMHYDYETNLSSPPNNDRSLWYKRLFSDPVFKARAKERWAQYKASFETIPDFVDQQKALIETPAARNWTLWTIGAGSNKDETMSWEAAVERLKTNYKTRLNWLDQQIGQWK